VDGDEVGGRFPIVSFWLPLFGYEWVTNHTSNSSAMNPQKKGFSKARTIPKPHISCPMKSIVVPTPHVTFYEPYRMASERSHKL
jgi:hypothetical protein